MTDFSITEPGIYPGIPDRIYHADPYVGGSFSSTQAKDILESPATYMWKRLNPQPPKSAYELGTLVHSLVLGVGAMPVVIPEKLLSNGAIRTNAAKEWVETQRSLGNLPMKAHELEHVQAVADAVKAHPLVAELMADGEPEVSFFAPDPHTGVTMRGRADWVTKYNGRTCLLDVKTTKNANPFKFARTAADLGYAVQREWYKTAWALAGGEPNPLFFHVAVSTKAPFHVAVCEMDWAFEDIGKSLVRRALDTYKRCSDSGEWPGYPPVIYPITPPPYYLLQSEGLEA